MSERTLGGQGDTDRELAAQHRVADRRGDTLRKAQALLPPVAHACNERQGSSFAQLDPDAAPPAGLRCADAPETRRRPGTPAGFVGGHP
jgi:hypothetical protein